jgi:acyl carrier protein
MPVIGHNDQGLPQDVCNVLAKALGLPAAAVSPEARQGELAKWDSLGHLSVVMELEAHFSVSFTTDEALGMRSVADIVTVLKGKTHVS